MYIFHAPYVVCTYCMLQPIKRRESGGGGATDAAKYVRRIEEKGEKGEPNLHALARSTGGYHRGCCLILSAVPRPFDHSSPHRRLIRSEFHILPSPAMNQGCSKSALVEQRVPRLSFSGTAATASTVTLFVLAFGAETPESDGAGFLDANHVILAGLVRETILLVVVEEDFLFFPFILTCLCSQRL